jgi:Cell Wall Hydrolase
MQTGLSALGGAVKLGLFVTGLTIASFAAHLATAYTPTAARRDAAVQAPPTDLRGLIDAEAEADPDRLAAGAKLAQQLSALRAANGSGRGLRLSSLPPAIAQTVNAILPFSPERNPPAHPFLFKGSAPDKAAALTCLTQAVYYEAGFEPAGGGEAVAQVVLNRVRHPIFPHSVCGVVYQGADLKTGCQFSFACDGSLAKRPPKAAWERARRIAQRALAGYVMKDVGGATHYHTQWVVPWWRPTVTKVAQVGAHIFYRWPGGLGLPGAFNKRYVGHERIAAVPNPPALTAPATPALEPDARLAMTPAAPVQRLAALARAARAEEPVGGTEAPGAPAALAAAPPLPASPALRGSIGSAYSGKPDF